MLTAVDGRAGVTETTMLVSRCVLFQRLRTSRPVPQSTATISPCRISSGSSFLLQRVGRVHPPAPAACRVQHVLVIARVSPSRPSLAEGRTMLCSSTTVAECRGRAHGVVVDSTNLHATRRMMRSNSSPRPAVEAVCVGRFRRRRRDVLGARRPFWAHRQTEFFLFFTRVHASWAHHGVVVESSGSGLAVLSEYFCSPSALDRGGGMEGCTALH